MTRTDASNFGNNSKISRLTNETPLAKTIKKHKNGAVIMIEHPSEGYFEANISSVGFLTSNDFEGIYVSFQRPFKNISSLFEKQGVDVDKLLIIDGATAFSGEKQEKNPKCIRIPLGLDVDGLVRIICSSLSKLKSKNRFVFIDSLSTMALFEPFSDTSRFSELLVRAVRRHGFRNITFLFNVAEDLSQKHFFQDMAHYADEFIHIGFCT